MIKYILIIKNYIRSIFKSKQQKIEEQKPNISSLLLGINFNDIPEIKRANKLLKKLDKKKQFTLYV